MAQSKQDQDTQARNGSQDIGESVEGLGTAAADLGKEAQEQVLNLTEQVRQQATTQLTSQKERAVDTLETVSLLLHQAGEHAHQQDKALLANYVDKAAQQVGTLSESLAQQDVTQIIQTTKDFARREPMLFVGGALAAGFLGARFLRSSAQQPQETSRELATTGNDQLAVIDDTATDLPAYDIDQYSTASSEDVLGSTSPAPSDAMTPDATGFMEDYEAAVLEDSDLTTLESTDVLPDLEDIERTENL
jgi:ElaB/YqjD/DUF883 family membrane-anchored ribosome-binding protein